jgi:hypothetical protein
MSLAIPDKVIFNSLGQEIKNQYSKKVKDQKDALNNMSSVQVLKEAKKLAEDQIILEVRGEFYRTLAEDTDNDLNKSEKELEVLKSQIINKDEYICNLEDKLIKNNIENKEAEQKYHEASNRQIMPVDLSSTNERLQKRANKLLQKFIEPNKK